MKSRPSAPPPGFRFRIRIFGPFTLERDGIPVDSSRWQPRVRLLFQMLATAPQRRLLRDDLIDGLWPETTADNGAGNLRMLVHRLRLTLEADPPAVLSEHGWIGLNPTYAWDLDLDDLEMLMARPETDVAELEEAAARFCGEPLMESRYDDWAIPTRERSLRCRRLLYLRLATLHEEHGAHEAAARVLESVVQSDPLDEELMTKLLVALDHAGKGPEALRRYGHFTEQLADELDVSPAVETRAVAEAIAAHLKGPVAHSDALLPGGGFPRAINENPIEDEPVTIPSPVSKREPSPNEAERGPLGSDGTGRQHTFPRVAAIVVAVLVVGLGSGKLAITWGETPTRSAASEFSHPARALGSGPGEFRGPSGLTVDKQGNVFVADQGNDRIQEFSPDGKWHGEWGTHGAHSLQFDVPADVAISPHDGLEYVSDTGNGRIYVIDPSGQPANDIPFYAQALAVDQDGNIYATDLQHRSSRFPRGQLRKLSPDGDVLKTWSWPGALPGRADYPTGLAVDLRRDIYIADRGKNEIVELSPKGHVLHRWGTRGTGRGQFRAPSGVAVDVHGDIYVADSKNHRVQKLSSTGRWMAAWGEKGVRLGQFNQPSSIAVDAHGNIYVADYFNSRVQKLSPSGKALWATAGLNPVRT